MTRLLFVASVLLLALAQTPQATAFTFYFPKLPSNTVTYSCGSDALAEAVRAWVAVSDVVDGGCSHWPVISLRVIDPWPYTDRAAQTSAPDGVRRIDVRPDIADNVAVLTHEVGHALGLGHSADPNAVMYSNLCHKPNGPGPGPYENCNGINADDIAGIRSLYSVPAPTVAPTLTNTPPAATPTVSLPSATPIITTTPTARPTALPTASPTGTTLPTATPTPFFWRWRLFLPAISH
jgi:hypothetical protein